MTNDHRNGFTTAVLAHFAQKPEALAASFVSRAGRVDLSFGALEDDCRAYAAHYDAAGVSHGDVVLIFLPHSTALYGAFLGAMLIGAVPSLMPTKSPRQDPELYWTSHNTLLSKIAPKAVVADSATIAEMTEAGLNFGSAAQINIDEFGDERFSGGWTPQPGAAIALLQHSSGTTGLKKGVKLSFDAITSHAEAYTSALSMRGDDKIVSWLPLYHDMGLIACMITPIFAGVPVIHIDPFHWLTRPEMLLTFLQDEQGTLCWLPNFAFEHLTQTAGLIAGRFDLSHVRAFINCSEPCKPATFDRFLEAFAVSGVTDAQLQCCYAMAETVFCVSQTALGQPPARVVVDEDQLRNAGRVVETNVDAANAISVIASGTVINALAVEICNEARQTLPEGAVGEIVISGDYLFDGYNGDPEKTAKKLVDGRYFTGDLGFLHGGQLFVLGRMDDLMIVNGRNIYCHEVEAELAGISGLKPGRTVALAHDNAQSGSQVLLVIAERDSATPDVSETALSRKIGEKVFSVFQVMPRDIRIVDPGWLIKTTSGKISRAATLRKYESIDLERTNSGTK